ncbi:MAG: hypothetical protein NC244_03365 [Alistipes senegalensis]|nr:hypothetical protein [Alistipes senegalensis]
MGFFSRFFKKKIGTETKEIIMILKEWEKRHFPNLNNNNKSIRYNIYRTDSGEKIQLSDIRISELNKSEEKNIIDICRDIMGFFGLSDKNRLTGFISSYREKFRTEIVTFMDNISKMKHLSKDFRKDPIFNKIDYIFNLKLKILHNELVFCKFHRMNDIKYFTDINERLAVIYRDLQNLNNDFSECMYVMSSLEYANVTYHLESINMRVDILIQTAKEILNN